MRHWTKLSILLITIIAVVVPWDGFAASKTNIGINGGIGFPIGWWSGRWGQFATSEVNVRYEVSPGTGLLVLTGLGKGYISELSKDEVATEAHRHLQDDFLPYSTIDVASQDGSFQQIPDGIGMYYEQAITPPRLRGYGSVAFVVNLWRAERNQAYAERVLPPVSGFTTIDQTDNWSDNVSGSDIGAQAVLGITYQLNPLLYLDASAAYHYVTLDSKNNAIAYWGQPARTWSSDKIEDATNHADLIEVRFGIRFGK